MLSEKAGEFATEIRLFLAMIVTSSGVSLPEVACQPLRLAGSL